MERRQAILSPFSKTLRSTQLAAAFGWEESEEERRHPK